MQEFDWNDLKLLIALHRKGTLAAAGKHLRVSETTVARRIRGLEAALNTTLVRKTATGTYQLTDAGLKTLKHAEKFERQDSELLDDLGQAPGSISGTVSISSVPFIINRILPGELPCFVAANPSIVLELLPSASNFDLTKREADIALRFARPTHGGLNIKSRKLGVMEFAVFGPNTILDDEALKLDWIVYENSRLGLPQAQWLNKHISRTGEKAAPIRVADMETAIELVVEGVGKTILPKGLARMDTRLRALKTSSTPLPSREIWMLSHSDQTSRSSISAVKDWLRTIHWQ